VRSCERNSGIQRNVNVRLAFMTGRPKLTERTDRSAVQLVFGDEGTGLWLRNQDGGTGVLERTDAVHHDIVEGDADPPLIGQQKPSDTESDRAEDLNPLGLLGPVGDDEGPVRRDRETGWIDDVAFFRPQLDDLPDVLLRLVDPVDPVASAVEDEI